MQDMGTKSTVVPANFQTSDPVVTGGRRRERKKPPEIILGKKFPTNPYTDVIARYPTATMCGSLSIPLIIIVIALAQSTTIDASVRGFQVQDHATVWSRDIYLDIQERWNNEVAEQQTGITQAKKDADTATQRFKPTNRMFIQFEVNNALAESYYNKMVADGNPRNWTKTQVTNMFLQPFMQALQRYEHEARNAVYYKQLCFTNSLKGGVVNTDTPQCVPISSLTTYFFPGDIEVASHFDEVSIPWDGQGRTYQTPVSDTLSRLFLNSNYKWYVGSGVGTTNPNTPRLRSQITLGTPTKNGAGEVRTKEIWELMLQYYIVDLEYTFRRIVPPDFIKVTWGGDLWVDSLVRDILNSQYWFAPVGAVLAFILLFIHCRTMVIAGCALLQLLITYLTTFSIFAMRSTQLPLLSTIALFVAVAFGCDGTMVFYDTFNHSGFMPTSGRDNMLQVNQRIAYTFRKAYGGIFFSNLIALCCFAANSVSPFPAVREFAVMLTVLVLVNMFLFATLTPSYILFHHFYFSKRRRNLQRQKEVLLRHKKERKERGESCRHPSMERFLTALDEGKNINQEPTYLEMRDDEDMKEELARLHKELNSRDRVLGGNLTNASAALRAAIESNDKVIDTTELQDSDFADAGQIANEGDEDGEEMRPIRAAGGKKGVAHQYMSERIVNTDSIIQIPPMLLLKSQQTSQQLAQLLGEVKEHFKATQGDDMNRDEFSNGNGQQGALTRPVTEKGLPVASSDEDIGLGGGGQVDDFSDDEIPMGEEKVRGTKRTPTAGGGSPPIETIKMEDGGTKISHLSMLGIEPFPTNPDRWDAFSERWNAVASGIGLPEICQNPCAPMPVLAYTICCTVDPGLCCWAANSAPGAVGNAAAINAPGSIATDVGGRSPRKANGFFAPSPVGGPGGGPTFGDRAGGDQKIRTSKQPGYREEREGQRVKKGWQSPCEWWDTRGQVERKWCFGRFGKRVGETREEKDRRLLGKKVKHEGYGPLERALNNRWVPLVFWWRYPLLATWFVLLIVSIIFTSMLQPADYSMSLIEDYDMDIRYQDAKSRFVVEGGCDYCSAYYRKSTEYRTLSASTIRACANQSVTNQVSAYVDSCGVCMGKWDCVDCAGNTNLQHQIDDCGACNLVNSPNWNSCYSCENPQFVNSANCTVCNRMALASGQASRYGSNCSKVCNKDTCEGGSCHPMTGECVCYQDYTNGFFKEDPTVERNCTACTDGFVDLAGADGGRCLQECVPNSTGCACTARGKCRSCGGGVITEACNVRWNALCDYNGIAEPHLGGCDCFAGWDSQREGRCDANTVCNTRGVYYGSPVVVNNVSMLYSQDHQFAGCLCQGYWTGSRCTLCKCRNGGTCNDDGSCACPGAWVGDDCSLCADSCSLHGKCPEPWQPNNYDLDSCLAIYCPLTQLTVETACSMCKRTTAHSACTQANVIGSTNPGGIAYACHQANATCFFNATVGLCFGRLAIDEPGLVGQYDRTYCHQCKGHWKGVLCDTCAAPHPKLACTDDGLVTSCDGRLHAPGDYSYLVFDQCGVCGGDNKCIGCDGIKGSLLRLDACGVCGGSCTQPDVSSFASIDVTWMWGIQVAATQAQLQSSAEAVAQGATEGLLVLDPTLNLEDTQTLAKLNASCFHLYDRTSVIGDVQECIFADFFTWLYEPGTKARFGVQDPKLRYPPEGQVDQLFYIFAESEGRLEEVTFSSTSPNDSDFKVISLTARTRWIPEMNQRNPRSILARYSQFEAVIKEMTGQYAFSVSQSSRSWVDAVSKVTAVDSLVMPLVIGMIITFVLLQSISCSITITLIGWFNILGVVFMVFMISYLAGWTLGPVEQIGASLILGFSVEHTVQLIEGYLDALHASQSHMFARETTSEEALKQAFVRTGRACLVSSVMVIVLSLLFGFSDITVIARSAWIMLVINVVSVTWTFLFLSAGLAAVGPTTIFRHWTMMLITLFSLGMLCGIVVLGIYVVGGVEQAGGGKILGRE